MSDNRLNRDRMRAVVAATGVNLGDFKLGSVESRAAARALLDHSSQPEMAEISIHEGEDLYKEIRVENEMTDDEGEAASLKPGAEVDVIVEADSDATLKKPSMSDKSSTAKR